MYLTKVMLFSFLYKIIIFFNYWYKVQSLIFLCSRELFILESFCIQLHFILDGRREHGNQCA